MEKDEFLKKAFQAQKGPPKTKPAYRKGDRVQITLEISDEMLGDSCLCRVVGYNGPGDPPWYRHEELDAGVRLPSPLVVGDRVRRTESSGTGIGREVGTILCIDGTLGWIKWPGYTSPEALIDLERFDG